jgi:hypothetical protein
MSEPETQKAPRRSRGYQIALREDDLGLDDVVVEDVAMFRMERMDTDHVWFACYLADGQDIHFDLWVEGKTIKYKAREPLPRVAYEPRPAHIAPGEW